MARSAGRAPGSPVPEHGPVPPLGVSLYGRPWRSPCEPVPAISILHSSIPYVTAYGGQPHPYWETEEFMISDLVRVARFPVSRWPRVLRCAWPPGCCSIGCILPRGTDPRYWCDYPVARRIFPPVARTARRGCDRRRAVANATGWHRETSAPALFGNAPRPAHRRPPALPGRGQRAGACAAARTLARYW